MPVTHHWLKEPGPRLQGSRDLDSSKCQAPCIVRNPSGGFRLFYTAVGPGKPFPSCQGYILSAVSEDGLFFQTEPGIRLAPHPELPHMSLRILAPTVTRINDGSWRMYFESRGTADRPTVICSAVSRDMLSWELEDGIRLQGPERTGGPRFSPLPDGRGRLYCFGQLPNPGDQRTTKGVISAITNDGLHFTFEPGYRIKERQTTYDSGGVTAAEAIPPQGGQDNWSMVYSAWQDVPPGTKVPLHPSHDVNAITTGSSEDFAAASIATDMAGYRSRIFMAYSADGLVWSRGECAIEGDGYHGDDLDAVHAEDMSVIHLGAGKYRMYYAACDQAGNWRIASAISNSPAT